jgi:uncharacterized Zn-finger protein
MQYALPISSLDMEVTQYDGFSSPFALAASSSAPDTFDLGLHGNGGLSSNFVSPPTALQQTNLFDFNAYQVPIPLAFPSFDNSGTGLSLGLTVDAIPAIALAQVDEQRLRCPKGCKETFLRPGDYRRHMKKHDPPKFKCAIYSCDKTFYRGDKLRDHLKQGHKKTFRELE